MVENDLFNRLVKKINENNLDVDIEKIHQAYILANESHIGQKRRSGEDYILHPIEVAEILSDMKMDTDTIVAGILHDVVEDTLITLADIEYTFGVDTRKLVDGVTKLRNLPKTDSKKIENIRKMIVAMSEDIRVVIIKLADRLHNMRTLSYMKPEKQIEKSKETIEIFAPIAHRIGMAKIKWELEDIAFKYLNNEEFQEITALVNAKREEREEYTNKVIDTIKREFEKQYINAEITGRPKHLYSIYKKIHEKEKKFADLYDLIAIRILVEKEVECYNVLGVIHSLFIPVSGRFKDYIAVPKTNGYQSIHTTIVGPNSQNVEIQIRTFAMHSIAEDGVAAHWKYKEKKSKTKNDEYYAAVKKMVEKSTGDNHETKSFAKKITGNVLSQTIFAFTPKGDVIELPNHSTALDFAFHIHSQIGYRTVGAKINDKIAHLNQEVKNGDKVEILTSKNTKGPGKDWLNMVNNNSSKVKIKKWFKDIEYEEKVKEGEQILEKEFDKLNIKLRDIEEDERVFLYMKKFNVPNFHSLLYKFAMGDLSLEGFIKRFAIKEELNLEQILEEETEKGNRRKERSQGGITISGTENTMYHFAKCCSPLPGDDIRGFVTRVRGIVIHRENCENIKKLIESEPDREIEVRWDENDLNNSSKYEFYFTIKSIDRNGIVLEIIKILNDHKIEMVKVNTNLTKENGIAYVLIRLGIMIRTKEEFDRLANHLVSIKDIIEIIRK